MLQNNPKSPQFLNITSTSNERIKSLMHLRERKVRDEAGLFAVEGAREIARAAKSGFKAVQIFYCDSMLSQETKEVLKEILSTHAYPNLALVATVTPEIFSRLAVRENSDGIIAVFPCRKMKLSEWILPEKAPRKALLLVALEGVEKPGNLGAVLRSSDASGVDAVIVTSGTDPWNPNTIRASVGAVFQVPVLDATADELLAFCKQNNIRIAAAALTDEAVDYTTFDFRQPTCVLMGSEAHGLSTRWHQEASAIIKIPMLGIGDSLNVSVATSVILYEALRQKKLTV